MYSASIAAGIGGIVGGLLQVSLYIAQNCIMAIPAFIGEKGLSNLIYGIIMIVVSFVAAFVLTLIFGFEDVKAETEVQVIRYSKQLQKLFLAIGICSGVTLYFLRIPILGIYNLSDVFSDLPDHLTQSMHLPSPIHS